MRRSVVAVVGSFFWWGLLAGACSASGDGDQGPTELAETTAPSTTAPPTSPVSNDRDDAAAAITIDVPYPARSADELASILDIDGFHVLARSTDGFIGLGNDEEGGVTFVASDDGLQWTRIEGRPRGLSNLPCGFCALWEFGDGYLMHASLGLATSQDLLSWTQLDIALSGFTIQATLKPGAVSDDGSIGVFGGFNGDANGPHFGRVLHVVRADEEPVVIDNVNQIGQMVAVGNAIVGLGIDPDTPLTSGGLPAAPDTLFVLENLEWTGLELPPTNPGSVLGLRSLGEEILLVSTAETWASDDLGESWEALPPLASGVRDFGIFDRAGAAGPVEPAFGTAETFQISRDGRGWQDVPLPPNTIEIRHLASTDDGILSVAALRGDAGHVILFVPFRS